MIIPAYNEEESIFDTVTSILNYRKKVDFDLDYVVINDGSTDKTKQILEENHFNAVNLVMNLGIGGAVQTGYKYALEHDYDVAVQFDGDGQHDIESLSDLLEPIRKNEADLVIGSRFVGDVKSEFQTTFMRRFGISVISNLIKWTTGQRVLDTTSGYRLADKNVIKFDTSAIKKIIDEYTNESGVRELERCLNKITRKVITNHIKSSRKIKSGSLIT